MYLTASFVVFPNVVEGIGHVALVALLPKFTSSILPDLNKASS